MEDEPRGIAARSSSAAWVALRAGWRAAAIGAAIGLVAALLPFAADAVPPSSVSGPDAVARLKNAPIPASCRHSATTLDGFKKDFGPFGFAELQTKQVATVSTRKRIGELTIVPLLCSAGGVAWPELLLAYDRAGRLVGSVNLAGIRGAQENEIVTKIRTVGQEVRVQFSGTDGCCFVETTHRGVLGWKHGKLSWRHPGPLTIDFMSGGVDQSPISSWGVVHDPSDANLWLKPAPRKFRVFIKHRWKHRAASVPSCPVAAEVTVARYSHKGFAFGSESSCGGAGYIWGRMGGKWRAMAASQDYYGCGSASSVRRRAITILALTCVTKAGSLRTFGTWPRSGQ